MSRVLIGLLVGRMVGAGKQRVILPPADTALGALANHLISQNDDFQPMNINFGLFRSNINNLKGKKTDEKGTQLIHRSQSPVFKIG